MSRQLESEHFKSFRRNWPEFPDGEVWHDDSPDFLVHTSTGVIGIEHSQLFQPSLGATPPQAVEASSRDIVELAQEHAELRGMPPVSVDISFLDHRPLARADALDVARQIARLCFDSLPAMGNHCDLEANFRSPSSLPRPVSRVSIHRYPSIKRHSWGAMNSGMVLEDAIEILQGAITRKAERLPAYLANCSTCWLLLVAHGASPSTFIEPDPASLEHVYFSPFQRTFLLRYFQGRVFALSTHAGEGAV